MGAKLKNPNYTTLIKEISKSNTIKKLEKVQRRIVAYGGYYGHFKKLIVAHNNKNFRLRNVLHLKMFYCLFLVEESIEELGYSDFHADLIRDMYLSKIGFLSLQSIETILKHT